MVRKPKKSGFYDTQALVERSRRGYHPAKQDFFTATLARLARPDLRILDIACNDGELTERYARYGQVIGVDLNAEAVARCRRRGLTCLQGDVLDLPARYDGTFDVVIAGDIIEHIFDTDALLKKIRALLKPHGTLLLTTPNVASLGRRLLLLLGRNPYLEFSTALPSSDFNVGHVRYYTAKNLRDQLTAHRFKTIQITGDRVNLYPAYLPRSVARHVPSLSRNLLARAVL